MNPDLSTVSQEVNAKFDIDWHYFVASSLKYVVVTVDGRGTGYKGRKLRNPVKDNLGHWETQDQINAAKSVLPTLTNWC